MAGFSIVKKQKEAQGRGALKLLSVQGADVPPAAPYSLRVTYQGII